MIYRKCTCRAAGFGGVLSWAESSPKVAESLGHSCSLQWGGGGGGVPNVLAGGGSFCFLKGGAATFGVAEDDRSETVHSSCHRKHLLLGLCALR